MQSFKRSLSPKSPGVYKILVVITALDSIAVKKMVNQAKICQRINFLVFFYPELINITFMTKDFITAPSTMIFNSEANMTNERVIAWDEYIPPFERMLKLLRIIISSQISTKMKQVNWNIVFYLVFLIVTLYSSFDFDSSAYTIILFSLIENISHYDAISSKQQKKSGAMH